MRAVLRCPATSGANPAVYGCPCPISVRDGSGAAAIRPLVRPFWSSRPWAWTPQQHRHGGSERAGDWTSPTSVRVTRSRSSATTLNADRMRSPNTFGFSRRGHRGLHEYVPRTSSIPRSNAPLFDTRRQATIAAVYPSDCRRARAPSGTSGVAAVSLLLTRLGGRPSEPGAVDCVRRAGELAYARRWGPSPLANGPFQRVLAVRWPEAQERFVY